MAEIQELLRYVFETKNQLTIPVSGTGSAAMEASLCNFVEPGDEVVIRSQRLLRRAFVRYGRTVRGNDTSAGESLG